MLNDRTVHAEESTALAARTLQKYTLLLSKVPVECWVSVFPSEEFI